jgi:hypothetical protein
MAETKTTTQTPTTIDGFITTVVGDGYCRFIVDRPSEEVDVWFRHLDTGWHEPRAERVEPGFQNVLGRHGSDRIYLSPCAWRHPWTREIAFVTPLHALWVTLPLVSEPVTSEHMSVRLSSVTDFIRVSPESERHARTRLNLGLLPPSILVHEGTRLSAFWLLDTPLDAIDARRWLHQIATHFGMPRDHQCEPEMARFSVPSTRLVNVIPAHVVSLEIFSPELRYAIDDVRRWLEGT